MVEQVDELRDRGVPGSAMLLVGVRSPEMGTCTGVRGVLGENGEAGDAGAELGTLPNSLVASSSTTF